ncbi:hypothetical protein [Streptomyces iconiensis]|uniref:Uncharacterized protein n=1 Tax=Streptomyces iconiensis TaxID=1384038 RepID=A0ABT6ZZE9_9ACTN|nr:hypothetical protein [Streptomyces iconiensis]MDJ1134429.1 hypothetical protein [Streptomyces iconiensis]
MTWPALSESDILAPGHCCRCEAWVLDAVPVAVVEAGSGPGGLVSACEAHARELAAYPLAPDWLREDLAVLDRLRTEGDGRDRGNGDQPVIGGLG